MDDEAPPSKRGKRGDNTIKESLRKELESAADMIRRRIDDHDMNVIQTQANLHEMCNVLRNQIDEIEQKIYTKLNDAYIEEKTKLDQILEEVSLDMADEEDYDTEKIKETLRKAKSILIVKKTYEIKGTNNTNLDEIYDLNINEVACADDFVPRKPYPPRVVKVESGRVYLELVNEEENKILTEKGFSNAIEYKTAIRRAEGADEWIKCNITKDESGISFALPPVVPGEEYYLILYTRCNNKFSDWSDPTIFITREYSECCVWKPCPDYVSKTRSYEVSGENYRIATKSHSGGYATIIGNEPIPVEKISSWTVKIRNSAEKNSNFIYIGVAPFDISQDVDTNYWELGWYLNCYSCTLFSSPPHNFWKKEYGPRQADGSYVRVNDEVKVTMDTFLGDMSFSLDDNTLGCAFENIPLDKPLLPCVLVWTKGDSIEFLP